MPHLDFCQFGDKSQRAKYATDLDHIDLLQCQGIDPFRSTSSAIPNQGETSPARSVSNMSKLCLNSCQFVTRSVGSRMFQRLRCWQDMYMHPSLTSCRMKPLELRKSSILGSGILSSMISQVILVAWSWSTADIPVQTQLGRCWNDKVRHRTVLHCTTRPSLLSSPTGCSNSGPTCRGL